MNPFIVHHKLSGIITVDNEPEVISFCRLTITVVPSGTANLKYFCRGNYKHGNLDLSSSKKATFEKTKIDRSRILT